MAVTLDANTENEVMDDLAHLRGLGAAVQCIGVAYELQNGEGLLNPDDALQALGEQIVDLAKRVRDLLEESVKQGGAS